MEEEHDRWWKLEKISDFPPWSSFRDLFPGVLLLGSRESAIVEDMMSHSKAMPEDASSWEELLNSGNLIPKCVFSRKACVSPCLQFGVGAFFSGDFPSLALLDLMTLLQTMLRMKWFEGGDHATSHDLWGRVTPGCERIESDILELGRFDGCRGCRGCVLEFKITFRLENSSHYVSIHKEDLAREKPDAESTAVQYVGSDALGNMAIANAAIRANGAASMPSLLSLLISFLRHRKLHKEARVSKSAFEEFVGPRVRNNVKSIGKRSYVSHWTDERTRSLLLSKVKSLEVACGDHSADQGPSERTLLEVNLEKAVTKKQDDIPDDIVMPLVSPDEDMESSDEPSTHNRPQEVAGDNFVEFARRSRPPNWSAEKTLQNAQAIMMASSASQPDQQPLGITTHELALFPIDGQVVHHQCIHCSQPSGLIGDNNCSCFKGVGRLRKRGVYETSVKKRVRRRNWSEEDMCAHLQWKVEALGSVKRSRNWSPEEKQAFLELKVEALQVVKKGKDWDWISEALRDRHKIDRTAKGCKDLWTTLMRAFKAILEHESDYWNMDADARSARSLPMSFSRQWYEMMETILAEKRLRRPCSTESGATLKTFAQFIKQQVECEVDYAFERLRSSAVTSAARDKILTSILPVLKQQVEAAEISALPLYTLTGNVVVDEDMTRKYTEEALNFALQPLVDAWQTLAQEEQEDLAKLTAIEKQRQALDLQEKQIKCNRQCRVGGHHKTSRSGPGRTIPTPGASSRHYKS